MTRGRAKESIPFGVSQFLHLFLEEEKLRRERNTTLASRDFITSFKHLLRLEEELQRKKRKTLQSSNVYCMPYAYIYIAFSIYFIVLVIYL